MDMVDKAYNLAFEAHRNKREILVSHTSYIHRSSYDFSRTRMDTSTCSRALHDVIEDTEYT